MNASQPEGMFVYSLVTDLHRTDSDTLNVYVREDCIVPKLDEWIASLFDRANIDEACGALAAAGGETDADHARIEVAQ